jgi:hypothetical protein
MGIMVEEAAIRTTCNAREAQDPIGLDKNLICNIPTYLMLK